MRVYVLGIIMLMCGLFAQSKGLDSPLPVSDKVITGKLPNGITYYVRHNQEPKERASFYIIQNVGALLEEDHQNGLAHFLEHMAFNGTKHFPGKGIIETLERHGVSFGGNLNAYTSQEETVYNISSVPTTNEALIDTCLLILHDWSNYLSLEVEEIDSERGVISEEWRTRRNSAARIREITSPVIFKGSKYAERDVIGSLDVINNFEPQTIRDFYHDWYRTDLQAIVVVGDVDAEKTVQKIKDLFSKISAVENAKPRLEYSIPEHDERYYVLATDKETTRSSVQLMTIIPDEKVDKHSYRYLRNGFLQTFYNYMVRARLSEIMQQSNPPYQGGSIGFGGLVRNYGAYSCSTVAKPNEEAIALKTILTENERIKRFGFLDSELNRVKEAILASLESSYKGRDKFSSEGFVEDIQNNFLTDEPILEYEDYYEFAKAFIPTITVKDVMENAQKWYVAENQVVVVTGPDNVQHLTEAEVNDIIKAVEADTTIQPFEDDFDGQDLISEQLTGSKIKEIKPLELFDAEEWTLENGVKVVYRKADYEKDNVALYAYSKGGVSLYELEDLVNAENASAFAMSYGVGDFNSTNLSKALAGKMASCKMSIGSTGETVQGASTPADIETMFKLVYLRFMQPRIDEDVFQSMISRNLANIDQVEKTPTKILQDSVSLITSNYHPRTLLYNRAYLEKLDMNRMFDIYKERFANAADFTFFIVGNIEADELKPFVEKYLGSLNTDSSREDKIDRKVRGPKGLVKKVIDLEMETPKAVVLVTMHQYMPYELKDTYVNSVLKGILDLRYTENIREKEGGTYGVSVQASSSKEPEPIYTVTVNFECDPEKAEHLKSLVYAEFEKIKKEGVTVEEVDKIVKNMLKNHEQSKNHNNYWMNVLAAYYIHDVNNNDPDNLENILINIKPSDIQEFANRMFNEPNTVDLIFMPK